MFAAFDKTQYRGKLGRISFIMQTENVFSPSKWSSACLSVDSVAGKMTLVVDEQLLGEEEYKREEDEYRPANFSLVLGANLQEE